MNAPMGTIHLRGKHFLLPLLLLLTARDIQAGTQVQFRTALGNVEVELYDQQKPITTANFKRLIQSGAYQNTFFHRVIHGFVAQGGGYFSFAANATNLVAPPWSNLGSVANFGAISNEFSVGLRLSNTNGTIAMAKLGGNPNSATSEWFFNLNNNSTNLDNQNGGFTVFGHVVRDTGPTNTGGVLGFFNLISLDNYLANLQRWYGTTDSVASLFQNLPVTYSGTNAPSYGSLFYVDISLLAVQISSTNNQRQIAWNSIGGKTNIIEFTTVMPPVWQPLATTVGTGNRTVVTDATATNSFRFYRVRVAY